MSTAQKGNDRVGSMMEMLAARGYANAPIKASGRRAKRRGKPQNRVAGDLLAFGCGQPNLVVEVGGPKKPIRRSFDELRSTAPPTFVPMVARVVRLRWRFHVDAVAFWNLDAAIEAARAR